MYGQGQLLIVDDVPQVLTSLTRLLREEDYQVHTAQNAAEALAILKKQDIDVVLTDYGMPGMNGAELLNRVAHRFPHTIRVVLSGQKEYGTVLDAINLGQAYRFIDKPWDDWLLKETLRDAFREASQKSLATEYQQVLEGVREGLLIVDRTETIRDVNTALCTLLDYEPPMLLRQPARVLHLATAGETYDSLCRKVLLEGEWRGTLQVKNAHGGGLTMSARVKALYNPHWGLETMAFYLHSQRQVPGGWEPLS